jgi:hydroxymethylbilane synthase
MDSLRLGTRGSALAQAQAGLVQDALREANPGLAIELVTIRTGGDEGGPRHGSEDKSRFVKEIEDALLAGDIDLAVHSAKDLPGELPFGLSIVGVPARADPRDSLCGAESLLSLDAGARVGTSSLRRRAQLLALRPDIEVVEMRGNVDTRLRKLADGDFDAVVLAAAGLQRLGRPGDGGPIGLDDLTPAPGQGCLALEARADDGDTADLAAALTDHDGLVALTAERALVVALGATCNTPVGAHAELAGDALTITSFAGMPDGSTWIRDTARFDAAAPGEAGRAAAARLLSAGAAELLAEAEQEIAEP